MSFEDYAFNTVEDEQKKKKVKPTYVIGVAVLLLLGVIYVAMNFFSGSSTQGFEVQHDEVQAQETEGSATIFVHVAGEVKNPGMVELGANERVAKAIELAGGATENAQLDSINLAKKCEDGEQITVPSKVTAESSGTASSDSSSSQASSASSSSSNGKVNINTADATGLQQISGIGPSKAQKIIAYREQNGKFKSVEDLTNVSGIGEKTLASIKDQICV